MKFKQRAEKIIKHHQSHDQIKVEENIINKLQKSINAINNGLGSKLNKNGWSYKKQIVPMNFTQIKIYFRVRAKENY